MSCSKAPPLQRQRESAGGAASHVDGIARRPPLPQSPATGCPRCSTDCPGPATARWSTGWTEQVPSLRPRLPRIMEPSPIPEPSSTEWCHVDEQTRTLLRGADRSNATDRTISRCFARIRHKPHATVRPPRGKAQSPAPRGQGPRPGSTGSGVPAQPPRRRIQAALRRCADHQGKVAAHRIPHVVAEFGVAPDLAAFERCLAGKAVGEGNALTMPDAVDAAVSLWSAEPMASDSRDRADKRAAGPAAAAAAGPQPVGDLLPPPASNQPQGHGTLSRPPAVATGEPVLSVQVRASANTLRSVLGRRHARPASASSGTAGPGGAPSVRVGEPHPEDGGTDGGAALPVGLRSSAAAASSDRLHAMPLQKTVVASLSAPHLWKPEAAKRAETRSLRQTTRRRRGVAESDRALAGGLCGAVNLVARQTATEMARRAREDEALDQREAVRMSRKLQRRTRRRLLRFHEQNRRYHLKEALVQKRRVQALGAYLQDARVAETRQRRARGPEPLPRGPPSSPLMIMRELERRGLPTLPENVLPPVFVPHRTATVTKARLQALPMDGAGILDGGADTAAPARSTKSPVALVTPPPVARGQRTGPRVSAERGYRGGYASAAHGAAGSDPSRDDTRLSWPGRGGDAPASVTVGAAAEQRAVDGQEPGQDAVLSHPRGWTGKEAEEGHAAEWEVEHSATYASPTHSAALHRRGSVQAHNLRSALQSAVVEEAGPPLPSLGPVRSAAVGAGVRVDSGILTDDDSPRTTVMDRMDQMNRRAASMRHSASEPASSVLSADSGAGGADAAGRSSPAGGGAAGLTSHSAAQLHGEAAVEALVQYGRHLASSGASLHHSDGDGTWQERMSGTP